MLVDQQFSIFTSSTFTSSETRVPLHKAKRVRDKTADFRTRQNSRFSKRGKTADFQNGTK